MTAAGPASAPLRHYGAPMLSRQAAHWGVVRATIIRRERTDAVVQRFRLPWHAFRLGISGSFGNGSTTALGELAAAALTARPGGATFYPAGTGILNAVTDASRLTYLMVEIDHDPLDDGDGPALARLLPVVDLRDPLCLTLLAGLRREVEQPSSSQRLFAETAALMLLLAVARTQVPAAGVEADGPRRRGLAPRQLARVTDYIADHLAEEVTLADLARHLGLSRSHLCRAFKASTGTTLHRWHTQARVERAKHLLRQGKLPLAAVALAMGFADQPHFTRAFRRVVGTAPGAWRRSQD